MVRFMLGRAAIGSALFGLGRSWRRCRWYRGAGRNAAADRRRFNPRATTMKTPHLLFAVCLAAATCLADEVRLKDGRVLVGKVERQGDALVVTTRDGAVRVPEAEVAAIRPEAELRRELRKMEQGVPDSPFAHLQLAAQARTWGLEAELWQHLDAAVALPRSGERQALRCRLDDFLAQLEPELLPRRLRNAATQLRIAELLGLVDRRTTPGRRAAIEELLVREPNADQHLRGEARANREPARRLLAQAALLRRGTKGNDTFVLRSAVIDPSEEVRTGAMELARALEPQAAIDYLAPGLAHGSAEVRVRTAEAYGNLGSPLALKYLVAAGPNAGRALADADPGMRAHIAFIEQQAYIRDFDVEVASASFIADPKVGILQSGTVLDVTVHSVITHQVRIVGALRGAIQKVAGADPGANPARWASWLLERSSSAPTGPAPTTGGRRG